jgi:prevent-host-death family protein
MHTVTATEASRSFATLLNEAEGGETIVITRAGRRIAMIGPVEASNGAELLALLAAHPSDENFAGDVRAVRDSVDLEGPAWPAD